MKRSELSARSIGQHTNTSWVQHGLITGMLLAGNDRRIRLAFCSSGKRIAFLVYHFLNTTITDIYLKPLRGKVTRLGRDRP